MLENLVAILHYLDTRQRVKPKFKEKKFASNRQIVINITYLYFNSHLKCSIMSGDIVSCTEVNLFGDLLNK